MHDSEGIRIIADDPKNADKAELLEKVLNEFLIDDIHNIVDTYAFSRMTGIDFDCPFCEKVIPGTERHFEDGLCPGLGGMSGR